MQNRARTRQLTRPFIMFARTSSSPSTFDRVVSVDRFSPGHTFTGVWMGIQLQLWVGGPRGLNDSDPGIRSDGEGFITEKLHARLV